MQWLPKPHQPLRLPSCSVHVTETRGNQQTLTVRTNSGNEQEEEEEEEAPGIYANVNVKGKQLLHTDPGAPPENLYMNVTDAKKPQVNYHVDLDINIDVLI